MSGPVLIDTHVHLDDPVFDHDRAEVIARAAAAGVRRVINVGYQPTRWRSTIELVTQYPLVRHMLGLHPQHADDWSPATKDLLVELLQTSAPVAVGEIGLDYFRNGTAAEVQRTAFAEQLVLATELGMPVVIHHRAAEDDLIAALSTTPLPSQVLLHSFEGTNRLADVVNDRGFYVGIGGLATRAGSLALRQTLRDIPLDRVVLETDSPYLAPTGSKDRRNTPANIPLIAERLASIWDVDPASFAAATTRNAERFFGSLIDDGQWSPTVSNA